MKYFLLLYIFTILCAVNCFAQVQPQVLSKEVKKRFEKVPEFSFIQKEANKLGVTVYLFGGTASAFAHYVRWDLEREAGDKKYQKERFDYDFTNIYRGNQDLDIVVDGTAEQAASLQSILKSKFPHFVGDRDAWEVRLLRAQIGDKLPLLGDEDFKNQHTDTNSTGLLVLNSKPGDIVFRDLLDWENASSDFLNDVAGAKIRYVHSNKHETTSRFKSNQNPPVLSAIRYLAKLTQYEVKGSKKDLDLVKRIIQDQDFTMLSAYSKQKAKEFGLKALLNSPDVEYALDLLDRVGLTQKLISMDGGQIRKEYTLSWWMSKEPLRSVEVGQGKGATAKSLGIDIVAHETKEFPAYDNITRSSKGRANVFISRDNTPGEAAVFGNGFYTQIGKTGARGTGLTVRFHLDPEARQGTDFILQGSFVIVRNKNAISLIQENLNISLKGLFLLLTDRGLTGADKGLIEKLNRKFKRSNKSTYKAELEEVSDIIRELNFSEGTRHIFDAWFSIEGSEKYLDIVDKITEPIEISRIVLSKPHFGKNPELFKKVVLMKSRYADPQTEWVNVLALPHWVNHPELIYFISDNVEINDSDFKVSIDWYLIEALSVDSHITGSWAKSPYFFDIAVYLFNKGRSKLEVAEKLMPLILEQKESEKSIAAAKEILEELVLMESPHPEDNTLNKAIGKTFKELSSKNFKKLAPIFFKNNNYDWNIFSVALMEKHIDHPEFLFWFLPAYSSNALYTYSHYFEKAEHLMNHPVLQKYVGQKKFSFGDIMEMDLKKPFLKWYEKEKGFLQVRSCSLLLAN